MTDGLPLGINVQTNYTCNLRCRFCQYGQERVVPQQMELPLYHKVLDELASLRYAGTLGLFETNEPLTDARICRLVADARGRLRDAHLYLFTNGELLTIELCRGLFEAGLDRLVVDFYRRSALRRFTELGLYPREALETTMRAVGVRNAVGIAASVVFVERWRFQAWENRGRYVNPDLPVATPVAAGCDRVLEKMFIKPNGNAVACSMDYHDELVLGSVQRQSLMEIWRGEAYRALRQRIHASRAKVPLCATCTYSGRGGNYHNGIFRPISRPVR